MSARFISLVYINLHTSHPASVTNKNGGANKKRRKSSHPWTWGSYKKKKKGKNKQIIHLQAAAVLPIEAKMNGHIIGVTYRLNTQSSPWNTAKAERKQRNTHESLFIYFLWRLGEMWQFFVFFLEALGPHVWSAASVREHFTSQTTIAAVHLKITL